VDGLLKGTVTTSPYTYAFNALPVTNGNHTLVAKAYDGAGNVGTSASVTFAVNNPDAIAPTVIAREVGVAGTLTFTATASDAVGVAHVDYYVDGTFKGKATLAPYTFVFASRALANGAHALVAKAYDAAGNIGTSDTVSFTLNNDFTAPTVSATVAGTAGTLSFTANAADDVGVVRVDYYVDGLIKGSATAAPYAFSFNSIPMANGNHALVAKAYDAAGNVGTSATVIFAVNNPDTTAPTVAAKVTGAMGTILFTAVASDNRGVTRVDYAVDGTPSGSSTTGTSYSVSFNSMTLSDGRHTLVAHAFDAAGNMGTSAALAFSIDNTAPTVMAQVTGTSGTLTFTATAADNVGVVRVDYYVDGVLKGKVTATPYVLAFLSRTATNGTHSLVAKAYDAAGNAGTSAALTFTLNNDFTAPAITAMVDGTAGTLTFSASATDDVGVARVDYYVDNVLKGSSTISPYAVSYNSIPVVNGNHTLVAKAYDAAGNLGTSTVPFTVNNPDVTPPTVSAKVTGAIRMILFTATATDNRGVTRVNYTVDGTLSGSSTAGSTYAVTFNSATLSDGKHTLVAQAFDAVGNMGTSAAVVFLADNTAPVVTPQVTGTTGMITFTTTATDSVGITRVDYYVDGLLKGSNASSPYTYAFNALPVVNGTHTLLVKGFDAAGNVGTSTITFTVNNPDIAPPTVSVKVTGTSGTLTFTATATDNRGVVRVDYYVDGVLQGSSSALPYTLSFNSLTVTNGLHSLMAKAVDAAGNIGTSLLVSFPISNVPPPSSLTETEPNDSPANANSVVTTVTSITGAISNGSDVDTFAIPLTTGKTVQLILTPPPGMYYGLQLVQGLGSAGLRTDLKNGKRMITIPAPPPTATQVIAYIQVFSLTGQGSASPYGIAIVR